MLMSPRFDRALERSRDPACGIDDDADQRSIRGLDAAVGDQLDQRFGKVEQPGDAIVGSLELGRRQIDALAEVAEFVDHHVAMREVGGGRPGDAIDLAADRGEAVLHPLDDALDLLGAFAGALGPQRGVAALADQVADLAVEIANGIADQVGRLAGGLGEALHLARDHGKALAALPARAASMVAFSASRLVCLAIASIEPDTLATCASAVPTEPSRRSMRPTASISAAICWTAVSTAARDWVISPTAADGSGLHRPRRVGNLVIGRDHRLGGLLQMPEPVGLAGDTAGDFLQIACHVRELDAEAADPVRKLIDQTFAV